MRNVQKPKTKHHFLPRFYLKGFADNKTDPYIWQYVRGAGFCPAKSGDSRNPQRVPVSRAAMIQYLYAYTNKSGTIEYEKIENELEKLEKPHDEIIRKIRTERIISQQEKDTFSCYIDMMMRRVPSGIQWSAHLAPKALEQLKPDLRRNFARDWHMLRKMDGATQEEITDELKIMLGALETAIHDYEKEIPYECLLLGLLRSRSQVSEYISRMTWQFFVAPRYAGFITSDSPVVLSKALGIRAPEAEIIFPVSTEVALVASNRKDIEEGYVVATPAIVREINHRLTDTSELPPSFDTNERLGFEFTRPCFAVSLQTGQAECNRVRNAVAPDCSSDGTS